LFPQNKNSKTKTTRQKQNYAKNIRRTWCWLLLLVIGSEREAKIKSGVLPEFEMKPERKETIKKM
jgi:hypothetical protein